MSSVYREVSSWDETANADNAVATATRAAPAGGLSHFITSVAGGFSAAAAGKTLILKQGVTERARWYVHNSLVLSLPSPIKLDPGTVANLELQASGTLGVIGAATMTGYTL
jgi:hypothetical protein